MSSKVQICNRALSAHLGVGRINALSEDAPAAEQCNLHYDDTLQTLLELHRWSWAQRQDVLAELTNDRSTEWAHAYQVPSNCLRIHWVNDAATARSLMALNRDPDTDREILGDTLYSDVPTASIRYTTLVEDPTIFPMAFQNALAASLAANMALPLTENGRLAAQSMDMAERLIERAIVHDESKQRLEVVNPVPSWYDERGVSYTEIDPTPESS